MQCGFNGDITGTSTQGTRWLDNYNDFLKSFSILDAIHYATTFAPNSDLATTVVYSGNANNTVYSAQNTSLMSLHENNFTTKNVEIPFVLNDEIKKVNINNNNLKYNILINKIKEIDSSFDIKDYKVTEHIYNKDDGNGIIKFDYYINGEIETNKVFMATVENNVIKKVALVGVLKDNYSKMKLIDESSLINKINKNIKNVERNTKLIMNTNKNSKVTSHYFYDYNDGTLKNITDFTKIDSNGLVVKDVHEMILL